MSHAPAKNWDTKLLATDITLPSRDHASNHNRPDPKRKPYDVLLHLSYLLVLVLRENIVSLILDNCFREVPFLGCLTFLLERVHVYCGDGNEAALPNCDHIFTCNSAQSTKCSLHQSQIHVSKRCYELNR